MSALALLAPASEAQDLLHTLISPNEEEEGSFGYSVAGVDDLDGDGVSDLLIGAPHESPGASPDFAGRAYVFSGASGALLHELSSPNEEEEGLFGSAVAGVGDLDGDGAGDLLVGAHRESPGTSPSGAGRAYVFSGASGAPLHTLVSPHEEHQGRFGYSVSGVGDLNGDGVSDLLVGAHREGPDGSPIWAGRAYVFSGESGALLREVASPREQFAGQFGSAVAGVGDLDGDGAGDLLVGAELEGAGPGTPDPPVAGRAYAVSGSARPVASEPAPEEGTPVVAAPNPVSDRAALTFTLAAPSSVRLQFYDALGRAVLAVDAGRLAAGPHRLGLDVSALPAGVYVWRLSAGESVETGRLTVAR